MTGRIFRLDFGPHDFILTDKSMFPELDFSTLYNLFDIARKWGDLGWDRMLGVPSLDETEIAITTHCLKGGLGVLKRAPELGRGICATSKGTKLLESTTGQLIIWGGEISVEQAKKTIEIWDKTGKKEGWFESDGTRAYVQSAEMEMLIALAIMKRPDVPEIILP